MHKIILNERNLCHDDLGKKKVKYAAMDVSTKREMLDLEKAKFAAMDIGKKERFLKRIMETIPEVVNPNENHSIRGFSFQLRTTCHIFYGIL